MSASQQRDVGRALTGGALFGALRLAAVIGAGLAGTVFLARFLGPARWGVYTAGWSISLLLVAVLTHGVRDHLVARTDIGLSDVRRVTRAITTSCVVVGIPAALIAWLTVPAAQRDPDVVILLATLVLWTFAYIHRLPATVGLVRTVDAWRVMVIESLDAVVVPTVGIAAYVCGVHDIRALAIGVLAAAVTGTALGHAWRDRSAERAASDTGRAPVRGLEVIRDARHLTSFYASAVARELAIPPLVLISCGAQAAGAFGVALPLGALISLAFAVTAQPAYGAISSMQSDPARIARLTNLVSVLLAATAAIGVSVAWLITPTVLRQLYGGSWDFATMTVSLVLVVFTVNAVTVPWVNVAMLDVHSRRSLAQGQGAATLLIVVAALLGDRIGGIAVIASVFLFAQLAFAVHVHRVAHRSIRNVSVAPAAWSLVAGSIGVGVATLDTRLAWLAPVVVLATLWISPVRAPLRAAVYRVARRR